MGSEEHEHKDCDFKIYKLVGRVYELEKEIAVLKARKADADRAAAAFWGAIIAILLGLVNSLMTFMGKK